MDLIQVAAFVAGMVWGSTITLWILLNTCTISKKHPYRWECHVDGCFFSVSSNQDFVSVNRIADKHLEHHRET